jgi:hypothetical protein
MELEDRTTITNDVLYHLSYSGWYGALIASRHRREKRLFPWFRRSFVQNFNLGFGQLGLIL